MILEAEGQVANLFLTEVDGSIADSFWREKAGRLRRVEGTQREMDLGMRAEKWAACGLMSTMRAAGSLSQEGRSAGATGVNAVCFRDMVAIEESGGGGSVGESLGASTTDWPNLSATAWAKVALLVDELSTETGWVVGSTAALKKSIVWSFRLSLSLPLYINP